MPSKTELKIKRKIAAAKEAGLRSLLLDLGTSRNNIGRLTLHTSSGVNVFWVSAFSYSAAFSAGKLWDKVSKGFSETTLKRRIASAERFYALLENEPDASLRLEVCRDVFFTSFDGVSQRAYANRLVIEGSKIRPGSKSEIGCIALEGRMGHRNAGKEIPVSERINPPGMKRERASDLFARRAWRYIDWIPDRAEL